MDLTQLLAFTMQNRASDLHISSGSPPIIRVSGHMKRVKGDPLSPEVMREMIYSVMTDDQRTEYEKNMELDFAVAFGEKARFRVNAFNTRRGPAAVFRTIPTEVPTMAELELPPIMRRFAELEKGIILVTGPTGSGKSTTLASLINHINLTQAKHIITIEDPVEFFHESKKSLINHRELGADTKSFKNALKSALREDPDVILVGEMRDHETISLALTAAETGHLVFGTLHSSSASKTIDRIIDVFPTGDKEMVRAMLSSSIQGVVAQTLLSRADGMGRVGAFEILVGTSAVRNLIRENQIPQIFSMMQTGSRYGMITMEDAVRDLLESGQISEEEAHRALLKSSDEGGTDVGEEGAYGAAALGGGKIPTGEPTRSQSHGHATTSGSGSESQKAEGGYSF
ncbi:MAG: type IV pilus twitching motility protein PilT [Rhodospirillales bacterium]|nr:type IV pilus twitching motility protein PilT [Rhodospirillales bacterium]MCB9980540.1 type IV pilus twitching motility protein PilT [Rhodospirillales bacterium]